MKFTGGGGSFAKFDKIGDRVAGKVVGTRELPNKFQNNAPQTVVDLLGADGVRTSVRLDKRALIDTWAQATAKLGDLVGKTIVFEFVKTYQSKRGGAPGKDITLEILDGPDGAPAAAALGEDPSAEAYARLVAAKGDTIAAQIKRAVEAVEKDAVKRAAMYDKQAGVAA